jgi:uncharacterized membrane protein
MGLSVLFLFLFWGGLIVLDTWLWRKFGASEGVSSWTRPQGTRQALAREIPQTGYARGELAREEFQGMLQDVA